MKEKIKHAGNTHVRSAVAWFFVGTVALGGAFFLWRLSGTLTVF